MNFSETLILTQTLKDLYVFFFFYELIIYSILLLIMVYILEFLHYPSANFTNINFFHLGDNATNQQ